MAKANRLADESSPYLLQHARNPVDWRPWGPEAFAAARERDVPIFLSIGYSTCYWCHVMERESFEDEATAAFMNERFVCIKVDREERPDVDDVYMAATQILSGRGGWPMSVWLEPAGLRPYWAGTYYPPKPMHGLPSFRQALGGMSQAYAEQREDVLNQAERLAAAAREQLAERRAPSPVGQRDVAAAVSGLLKMHDSLEGGFGGAPKFPQPVYLDFLLDVRAAAGDEATRDAIDAALRKTLDAMAIGGLFDQVGGGFHRYCVDRTWTVPHFEKMLYDNAMLLSVYGRAAVVYEDGFYERAAARTLAYLEREMLVEDSGEPIGFAAAQDAEVAGREGLNYVWTDAQAASVLSADDLEFARAVYRTAEPNFRDPHHPNEEPAVVPRLSARPESLAAEMGVPVRVLHERLERVNAALLAARDRRTQPGRDGKVLASWNGMLLTALSRPFVLAVGDGPAAAEPDAVRAMSARLLSRLGAGPDGRDAGGLTRSLGTAIPAVLEDFAHLVAALVGSGLVDEAERLAREAIERFGADDGGFYDTAEGGSDLFVRPRTTYDGATPSGGSVMIHALIDLAEARGLEGPGRAWLERAVRAVRSVSGSISEQGLACVNSTRALFRLLRIAGGEAASPEVRGLILSTLEVDRAGASGREGAGRAPGIGDGEAPVMLLANAERIRVGPDEPAELWLRLRVREGFHVIAADPTGDGDADGRAAGLGLHPLRVGLVSGGGVAVYADYPEGEPDPAAAERGDRLLAYRGEVDIRVAIEHAPSVGVGPGRPILGVSYQACTDTECLMPGAVELDVAIDGAVGGATDGASRS